MVEWKVKGLFKGNAEQVYAEINSLGDSYTPEMIVEAAKDENSELHKCFTWDDTAAAEKWRKHEARILVASLVVRVETAENGPVAVRVISSSSTRNVYTPTQMLIRNETEYADLLARAKRELEAFRIKYKTVEELHDVFAAIDSL